MRHKRVVWFAGALLATLVAAFPLMAIRRDGWRQSFHFAVSDTVELWTTRGWLCAERVNGSGQVDWAVVLSPVRACQTPECRFDAPTSHLTLSYSDCYVEQNPTSLQIRRVSKLQSDDTWPRLDLPAALKVFGRSKNPGEALEQFRAGEPAWDGDAVGPARDECDAFARLAPESEAQQCNQDGVSAQPASVSAWLGAPPHAWFLDNGTQLSVVRDHSGG